MGKNIRVLVVEDSADDAELAIAELEHAEFTPSFQRVWTADALRSALQHAEFDLVLADYSMPKFDALKALEIVQDMNFDIPFIIVSGAIGEDQAVVAMRSGAHDYIMKDRLARLAPAVERELKEAQLRADRRHAQAERERLLEEAQSANRMKDEFLAVLSHELRTPMNAIMGWSELLANATLDSGDHNQAYQAIYSNARAQTKLINDLLDSSRIMAGKLSLETQSVDLLPLIQCAIESECLGAQAKNIDVKLQLDQTPRPVFGDPNRLRQVICNLLSNAIKFTGKGGLVEIRVQNESANVTIQVVDTGEGIDREFLPHVFDRFRQADASNNRCHGGLGLGLAIAKHLVELHNGTIKAYSEGKGKGVTLTVSLPAITKQVAKTEKDGKGALKKELQGIRVLVVDDQPDVLLLVRVILKRYEAYVRCAETVAEGMAFILEEKPDVILSDIGMPDEDGYAFIRKIRSLTHDQGADIPVAALTAHVSSEERENVLAHGFNMHIAKPVDSKTLLNAVASLASTAVICSEPQ